VETVSSPIYSFAVDDLVAEKGDEASSSQALSEENQAKGFMRGKSSKAEGNLLSDAKRCSRPSQGC
jgi:hypothetical protein